MQLSFTVAEQKGGLPAIGAGAAVCDAIDEEFDGGAWSTGGTIVASPATGGVMPGIAGTDRGVGPVVDGDSGMVGVPGAAGSGIVESGIVVPGVSGALVGGGFVPGVSGMPWLAPPGGIVWVAPGGAVSVVACVAAWLDTAVVSNSMAMALLALNKVRGVIGIFLAGARINRRGR